MIHCGLETPLCIGMPWVKRVTCVTNGNVKLSDNFPVASLLLPSIPTLPKPGNNTITIRALFKLLVIDSPSLPIRSSSEFVAVLAFEGHLPEGVTCFWPSRWSAMVLRNGGVQVGKVRKGTPSHHPPTPTLRAVTSSPWTRLKREAGLLSRTGATASGGPSASTAAGVSGPAGRWQPHAPSSSSEA